MEIFDNIRQVIGIVQKLDNVELQRNLVELSAQVLELQNEIMRLKEENSMLKETRDISARIVRHEEPVVTLKDEVPQLFYCSHCWDSKKDLIQVHCLDNGSFTCPACGFSAIYDKEKDRQAQEEISNVPTVW